MNTSQTILEIIPKMSMKELYLLYVASYREHIQQDELFKEEYERIRFSKIPFQNSYILIDIYDIFLQIDQDPTSPIIVQPMKQITLLYSQAVPLDVYRTLVEEKHTLLISRLYDYHTEQSRFESGLE